MYFEGDDTERVLISTHVLYDEIHMSIPSNSSPIGTHTLQPAGYYNDNETQQPLKVQLLSPHAATPTQSTTKSVGMGIYCANQTPIPIPPHGGTVGIPTDIAIEPPDVKYARLDSRNSLAFKSNVHVIGGVIDLDYRGNIKVELINNGDEHFIIKTKDRITQIILEKAHIPTISVVPLLSRTTRDKQ